MPAAKPTPKPAPKFAPLAAAVAALAVLSLAACTPSGGPGTGAPAVDTIRVEDLRADLEFLAGDGMRGRLAGSPENALAADFIASRFQRLGLEPAAGDSYFHDFGLASFRLGDGPNRLVVDGGPLPDGPDGELAAARVALDPGAHWTPQRISGSGQAAGEVVFAGHGIVAPGVGHDDYGDADVAGKVVLVLDGEPGEDDPDSPFDGVVTSEAARDWRKVLTAQERGAAAVLFVTDEPDAGDLGRAFEATWPEEASRAPRVTLAVWAESVRIPAVRVSPALAGRLAAAGDTDMAGLVARARGEGAVPLELAGVTVELEVSVERQVTTGRNVVARITGSDPELQDEAVVVCAHFDHDGAQGDRIFNGADDDGSGTVGLLEIAEAYALAAADGRRPRRTVFFAAWNYEERGLLGAWAWAEEAPHPLAATVAVLNMDMIGRNEEVPEDGGGRFRGLEPQTAASNANAVNLMGYSYSPELAGLVEEANREIGLDVRLRYDDSTSNLLRRSDHWPFLQHGVPSVFFHTGLHPDYHRPEDTADRIEYDKMARIVRLVHTVSWDLASRDDRPGMAKQPPMGR